MRGVVLTGSVEVVHVHVPFEDVTFTGVMFPYEKVAVSGAAKVPVIPATVKVNVTGAP